MFLLSLSIQLVSVFAFCLVTTLDLKNDLKDKYVIASYPFFKIPVQYLEDFSE